jgi:hypothetical protein
MRVASQAARVDSLKATLDAMPDVTERMRRAAAGYVASLQAEPRQLKGLWLDEAATPTQLAWRIRNVLPDGGAAVVMGAANSGKTFVVLDLVLHIAAGQPWRGIRTRRGLVVYVASEGGHGFRNRLAAAKQRYPWAKGAPFLAIFDAVNLLNGDADAIVAAVKSAEAEAGEPAAVVVLDTLARVMAGGDENSGQDMGKVVVAMDAIRAQTGAAVILVHHVGKDATKGARGHSSLRGAVDTEILVEGASGVRTATITKQRDAEVGQTFGFELVPVDLGRDDDGEPVTSCVVEVRDAPAAPRRGLSGKNLMALWAGVLEWQRTATTPVVTRKDLRAIAKAQGMKGENRLTEVITGLERHGHLTQSVGGWKVNANA